MAMPKQLIEAAKTGGLSDIKTALKRYPPQHGHREREKMCDLRDPENRTALHLVCLYSRNSDAAIYLLGQGFSYNVPDSYLATPLMYACRSGMLPFLNHVIEDMYKNSEENEDDNKEEICSTLVCTDVQGSGLLHYCFDAGVPCKEARKRHSSGTAKTDENKEAIVRKLVECSLPLNNADTTRRTPLNYAVENGYHEAVNFLLSKGAKLCDTALQEIPILHYKINYPKNENEDLREYLKYSKVDQQDVFGRTSLHYAALLGHPEEITPVDTDPITEKIKRYENEGRQQHRVQCAKIILECVPNINALDKFGKTPLQNAYEYNFDAMMELLLKNGGRVRAVNGGYAGLLHLETCRMWSKNSVDSRHKDLITRFNLDINDVDDANRTSLHYACFTDSTLKATLDSDRGRIQAVNTLIDLGIDINAKDDLGYTALMYAVLGRLLNVVALLVQHKADVMIKNKVSLTAINLAEGCGDRAQQFLHILDEGKNKPQKDDVFQQCYKSLGRVRHIMESNNSTIPDATRSEAIASISEAEKSLCKIISNSEIANKVKNQREVLEKHRDILCDELFPHLHFDSMRAKGILTEDHVEQICTAYTRRGQAQKLLDILPHQGPDALPAFISDLRDVKICAQEWLADLLEEKLKELD